MKPPTNPLKPSIPYRVDNSVPLQNLKPKINLDVSLKGLAYKHIYQKIENKTVNTHSISGIVRF